MATSTFGKEITIDEAAAERLAAALKNPPCTSPDIRGIIKKMEGAGGCTSEDFQKLSETVRKQKYATQ